MIDMPMDKPTAPRAERIVSIMLQDAFNAVEALYGEEGLLAVVRRMKMAAKARDSNAELDELERVFGTDD